MTTNSCASPAASVAPCGTVLTTVAPIGTPLPGGITRTTVAAKLDFLMARLSEYVMLNVYGLSIEAFDTLTTVACSEAVGGIVSTAGPI